jgi:hypothetical protein
VHKRAKTRAYRIKKMNQKYNRLIKQILEDFNVYPQHQDAVRLGPDIGMTTSDMQNTFPSSIKIQKINLPKKQRNKKTKKH